MLIGEAFDFLLPLLRLDRCRPNPRQLRIVNGADVLFLQFGLDSVSQLAHTEPLLFSNDSFFPSTKKK